MTTVHRFRMAMVKNLGMVVSSQMAADIEAEAFSRQNNLGESMGNDVIPAAVRERLCISLARHAGLELTRDVAVQIVNEALGEAVASPQDSVQTLPITPSREQIYRLEQYFLQSEQVETPTEHFFAPGLYARQMFIPAGTFLTGDVHKTEHLSIFVGDITVWTEGGMKRLTGHHTFVSKPGAKRVGFAHADTWCTGFFPSEKTDVAELERDLVENPHLLQCNRMAATEAVLNLTEV